MLCKSQHCMARQRLPAAAAVKFLMIVFTTWQTVHKQACDNLYCSQCTPVEWQFCRHDYMATEWQQQMQGREQILYKQLAQLAL